MSNFKCSAIIVAAGSSLRMKSLGNKQLLNICGKSVLHRTVERFSASPFIDEIILVVSGAIMKEAAILSNSFSKISTVTLGGETRADSVRAGLSEISGNPYVAVSDGARPFVSDKIISETILAAVKSGGAVPGVMPKDTVKETVGSSVLKTHDRSTLRLIQTPQVFRKNDLCAAYENAEKDGFCGTDDCSYMEHFGKSVSIVDGDYNNIKITTPEDVAAAKAILCEKNTSGAKNRIDLNDSLNISSINSSSNPPNNSSNISSISPLKSSLDSPLNRFSNQAESEKAENLCHSSSSGAFRVGFGYDVHALKEGRKLILGGVDIPHALGLLGHSDADVLIHALMDALLGASALGDIGKLFPDSSDEFKDISSRILLRRVADTVKSQGFNIINADITVAAQQPRISPYIEQMRENISADMGISKDFVSVKATTTEKLGFEGRKEGISAYAICSIL